MGQERAILTIFFSFGKKREKLNKQFGLLANPLLRGILTQDLESWGQGSNHWAKRLVCVELLVHYPYKGVCQFSFEKLKICHAGVFCLRRLVLTRVSIPTSLSWEYSIEIIFFFFWKKKTKKKIFTFWLGFAKQMTSQSNNLDVLESGQVATPIVTQVATPTVVAQAPLVHTFGPVSISPREKHKKFNGLNFKRWQQKMIFYLTTLNLARHLTKDAL